MQLWEIVKSWFKPIIVEKRIVIEKTVTVKKEKNKTNNGWYKTIFHGMTPESKGEFLYQQELIKIKDQTNCTHRKGGYAGNFPQGNSHEYAVLKHQFPWGSIWVRCLRCNKWWKPEDADYQKMLDCPTNNVMSTSIQFHGMSKKSIENIVSS